MKLTRQSQPSGAATTNQNVSRIRIKPLRREEALTDVEGLTKVNESFAVQDIPLINVDRFPATANPKAKRNYAVTTLTCHIGFYRQLAILGRPHTWMHFDDNNGVDVLIQTADEEELLRTFKDVGNKQRAKYFTDHY